MLSEASQELLDAAMEEIKSKQAVQAVQAAGGRLSTSSIVSERSSCEAWKECPFETGQVMTSNMFLGKPEY